MRSMLASGKRPLLLRHVGPLSQQLPSLAQARNTCFVIMPPLRDTPMRVLITGAAGQIGYALAPMVARGAMLGTEQSIILHLLDIPFAADALEGVRMELVDSAFPLVKGARTGKLLKPPPCLACKPIACA